MVNISKIEKRLLTYTLVLVLMLTGMNYVPAKTEASAKPVVKLLGASLRIADASDNSGTQSMRIGVQISNAGQAKACAINLKVNGKALRITTEAVPEGVSGVLQHNKMNSIDKDRDIVVYAVVITNIPESHFSTTKIEYQGEATPLDAADDSNKVYSKNNEGNSDATYYDSRTVNQVVENMNAANKTDFELINGMLVDPYRIMVVDNQDNLADIDKIKTIDAQYRFQIWTGKESYDASMEYKAAEGTEKAYYTVKTDSATGKGIGFQYDGSISEQTHLFVATVRGAADAKMKQVGYFSNYAGSNYTEKTLTGGWDKVYYSCPAGKYTAYHLALSEPGASFDIQSFGIYKIVTAEDVKYNDKIEVPEAEVEFVVNGTFDDGRNSWVNDGSDLEAKDGWLRVTQVWNMWARAAQNIEVSNWDPSDNDKLTFSCKLKGEPAMFTNLRKQTEAVADTQTEVASDIEDGVVWIKDNASGKIVAAKAVASETQLVDETTHTIYENEDDKANNRPAKLYGVKVPVKRANSCVIVRYTLSDGTERDVASWKEVPMDGTEQLLEYSDYQERIINSIKSVNADYKIKDITKIRLTIHTEPIFDTIQTEDNAASKTVYNLDDVSLKWSKYEVEKTEFLVNGLFDEGTSSWINDGSNIEVNDGWLKVTQAWNMWGRAKQEAVGMLDWNPADDDKLVFSCKIKGESFMYTNLRKQTEAVADTQTEVASDIEDGVVWIKDNASGKIVAAKAVASETQLVDETTHTIYENETDKNNNNPAKLYGVKVPINKANSYAIIRYTLSDGTERDVSSWKEIPMNNTEITLKYNDLQKRIIDSIKSVNADYTLDDVTKFIVSVHTEPVFDTIQTEDNAGSKTVYYLDNVSVAQEKVIKAK